MGSWQRTPDSVQLTSGVAGWFDRKPLNGAQGACVRTYMAAGIEPTTGDLVSLKNGPEVGICSAYRYVTL